MDGIGRGEVTVTFVPHVRESTPMFLLLLPVRPSSHDCFPASASAPPGSRSPAPPCLTSTRRTSLAPRRPRPRPQTLPAGSRNQDRTGELVFARFLPKSLGGGCMGTGSALGGCRMMCHTDAWAISCALAIPLQPIGSSDFILSSNH